MSDFRDHISPDEERHVPIDDEHELEAPPPTLDPQEEVEAEVDEQDEEVVEAAIEAGEIPPSL